VNLSRLPGTVAFDFPPARLDPTQVLFAHHPGGMAGSHHVANRFWPWLGLILRFGGARFIISLPGEKRALAQEISWGFHFLRRRPQIRIHPGSFRAVEARFRA
jgi:hypothetical protein